MTGFFEQPWPNTDHRGLFIDINTIRLFGATLQSIPDNVPRKVASKLTKIAIKFAYNIGKSNLIPDLLLQLQAISQIQHWTSIQSSDLDLIDSQFTSILLEAEFKCAVPTDTHWKSELRNKFITYTFWKISIRGAKSNKPVSNQKNKSQTKSTCMTYIKDHQVEQLLNNYNMLAKP
jgi:hypothetical protein